MPDYAVRALSQSQSATCISSGPRPAQAAFTNPELKSSASSKSPMSLSAREAELDSLSAAEVEASGDRMLKAKSR